MVRLPVALNETEEGGVVQEAEPVAGVVVAAANDVDKDLGVGDFHTREKAVDNSSQSASIVVRRPLLGTGIFVAGSRGVDGI